MALYKFRIIIIIIIINDHDDSLSSFLGHLLLLAICTFPN